MSTSKLAVQIIGIILIATCGYVGGVFVTRNAAREAQFHPADVTPGAWNSLPRVDGEIVACLPSPDYSRIAVYYVLQTPLCPIQTIAIYDPERKRLLGKICPEVGAPSSEWTWSPDSKWLTIPEENKELRMISRDGLVNVVPTDGYDADIVWRVDQPHKFLYTSSSSGLCEYNLITHSNRQIKTEARHAQHLFPMNGKPCIAGIEQDGSETRMTARLVDTGRTVLSYATPKNGKYSSTYIIRTSPDGRFVSLVHETGARARGIVVRREDLADVLAGRAGALYIAELSNPHFRVVWPNDSDSTIAIVHGRLVDLSDGCLRLSIGGVKPLAPWKSVTIDGKEVRQWLSACKFGLCVGSEDQSTKMSPILRQATVGIHN